MFPISDDSPRQHRFPYVNIALIAISVVVFFYEISLHGDGMTIFFYKFGVIPAELTQGASFQVLSDGATLRDISSPIPAWGTVFTSMFIHGGVLHILGNMVFLWVFGDNVEDRLGHAAYLLFYLAAGVAATWTQVAFDMGSRTPQIGASGAIAGVLGAYLLLYPFNQVKTVIVFIFITVTRLPAIYLLVMWFALQFFSGIGSLTPAFGGGGVAYWAHVGGFVAGVLAIAALKLFVWREPVIPRRRPPVDFWTPRWRG